MSLTALMPALTVALAASVAAMVYGVAIKEALVSGLAANAFALAAIAAAIAVNRPLWHLPADRIRPEAAPVAARRNARLLALTCAWAAAAFLAVYTLSGLRWQHGWQYAAAFALVAGAVFLYAHWIGRPDSALRTPPRLLRAMQLAILLAAGSALGLAWLFTSGKLASRKADWAANQIFLAAGLAVLAIAAIAAFTQWRLGRAGRS